MTRDIWMYWETPKSSFRPDIVTLCHETAQLNLIPAGFDVHILNDSLIGQYLDDIHPNYWNITNYSHKADYIRAKLIYKYGGMWLDSDAIVIDAESFTTLFEKLEQYEFVGFSKFPQADIQLPSVWAFLARPQALLLKHWIERMDEVLTKKCEFKWTEIACDILWDLLNQNGVQYYNYHAINAFETVYPIDYKCSQLYVSPDKDVFKTFQPFIMFNLASFDNEMKSMTTNQLVLNRTVLSKCLYQSKIFMQDKYRTFHTVEDIDMFIKSNTHHIDQLLAIVQKYCSLNTFMNPNTEFFEGNILFAGKDKSSLNKKLFPKVFNLMMLAKSGTRALEIGFNCGFSAMFMLLSNPNINIVAADICLHKYVKECAEYLNKHFDNRVTLIPGDSVKTLPNLSGSFDLIHIDGCHETNIAMQDLHNCRNIARRNKTTVVFDDTQISPLKKLWDDYVKDGRIRAIKPFVDCHAEFRHEIGVFVS
jgi:predicted O-methyltransferase YrrM